MDNVHIFERYSFMGPSHIDNNNYGLYVSNDLDLCVFYFKDAQRNLQIYYYKLFSNNSSEISMKL